MVYHQLYSRKNVGDSTVECDTSKSVGILDDVNRLLFTLPCFLDIFDAPQIPRGFVEEDNRSISHQKSDYSLNKSLLLQLTAINML